MWLKKLATRFSPREFITLYFVLACLAASPFSFTQLGDLSTLQIGLMATLVILFGLPHGALDVELATKMNLVFSTKTAILFLTVYLFLAMVGIALWLALPVVGLSIFLLISAFHFSDDWSGILPRWLCLIIGSIIICMPVVLHADTVKEIFKWLFVSEVQSKIIVNILYYCGLIGSVLFVVGLFIYRNVSYVLILEMAVLWAVATLLPPLLFFIVYFCFLHSLRHIIDCSQKLEYSPQQCYLRSLPILVMTLVIALSGYYLFNTGKADQDILRWVFIGLFALTIPHICLITLWYRSPFYSKKGKLR